VKEVPSSTAHCAFCVTMARLNVRFRKSEVDSRSSRPARSRRRIQTKKPASTRAPSTMRPNISARLWLY
jgi:hypothetical protein